MISNDDFHAAVKREYAAIKHLIGCVPATGWEYRPTPPQRSTLELARYLAHVVPAVIVYTTTGSWDHWDASEAKVKDLNPEQLAKYVTKQPAAIAKLLAPYRGAKLAKATVKDFDGKTVSLGLFLARNVLAQLAAYRMQLFLYAKSAGNAGIGSSDCWTGKAAKPAKPAKATKSKAAAST